jgi:3-oxoacyl-[acyl-carrier-protein] synthase-3
MTSSVSDICAVIAGTGGYLPDEVLDNEALASRHGLETSDAWIIERTGIRQRHLAAPGQTAGDMGAAAARAALAQAGIDAAEVDAIIVATATPDSVFPSTAARVQAKLGITRGFAFDLSAACTGFVYALSVADAMLRGGQAKCALVIGSEACWTGPTGPPASCSGTEPALWFSGPCLFPRLRAAVSYPAICMRMVRRAIS